MTPTAEALESYLLDTLLPRWAEFGCDRQNGGWHLYLDQQLAPTASSDFRRLVVQTRQIYCMSVAHRMGAGDWALEAATESVQHLLTTFHDSEHGGFYYTTKPDGTVLDDQKDTYAHAFVLLALSTFFEATGDPQALRHAEDTLALLDRHLSEPTGGYAEGAKRDWSPLNPQPDRRQNPHMHLLEAFLSLHGTTGEEGYLRRAGAMVQLFRDHFYDPETETIGEYFDQQWKPATGDRSTHIEPGHHFEWTWLLHQYADASGETDLLPAAESICRKALKYGMTAGGRAAIDVMDRHGVPRDTDQRAWPQTELLKALTARAPFDKDARKRLDKVLAHCFDSRVDSNSGLWREKFNVQGDCIEPHFFASTVYHIVLALVEVIRLQRNETAGQETAKK